MERRAYWLNEAIDQTIGSDNIPDHLRIQPTLNRHLVDPYTEF
jgi:hypothetical protein